MNISHYIKSGGSPQASVAPRITMHGSARRGFSGQTSLLQKRGEDHDRGTSANLPKVSPALLRWFNWYSRWYIRRHFHAVRISRSGLPPETELPLVIYSNHASWWDPLVGLALKAFFFPDRRLFAPIDANMLERYKMFAKLGFFGVQQKSRRGAINFLATCKAILHRPEHVLALTPQGRFADVRERPVRFEAGLGHLAKRVDRALFVPLVAEYVFWEERLPEVLVQFGAPIDVRGGKNSTVKPDDWTREFEASLQAAQDALSLDAQRRDVAAFHTILRGNAGQGGIYDLWRFLKAVLHGEVFHRKHGQK